MLSPLRSEIFRLVRRWMPRVLVLIVVLIVLAIYTIFWAIVRTQTGKPNANPTDLAQLRRSIQFGAVGDFGLSFVQTFGTLMIVILAASTIGNEFGWGTIRTILPRTQGRTAFLTAKYLALALFTALVVVAGFIAAVVASEIFTLAEGMNQHLGSDFALRTIESVGRTIYVALPYLALAVLVAVWTRSTAAGIGVGLGVLFLEQVVLSLIGLAGGVFSRLPGAFLSRNVTAIMHLNHVSGTVTGSDTTLPNPWQAAGVLAIYTIVFIALSFWLFRSRDITVG